MNHSKIVEIWSTYPPPYGGVTVHSMRLFETLKNNDEVKIIFKNFNGSLNDPENGIIKVQNFLLEYFILHFKRSRIVHLHSNNIKLWILMSLFFPKHKIILTVHNQNLRKRYPFIINILLKRFLCKVKYIILNDKDLSEYLINEYGIKADNIRILPAFIPPLPSEETGLSKDFLEFRNKFKYIISTSAWKLYKRNNIDVYGIKSIIESLDLLVKQGYSIGLIVLIPIIEDNNYYKELLEEISDLKLNNNVFISTQHMPNAFEIWKISNVYVRATNTDIEGLTIKEALYFNVPVVASDVVARPKEAILYKFGNLNDLTEKIIVALETVEIKDFKEEKNSCEQIFFLYNNI